MTERKKINFISSVEIMNTPMKKQRFIVEGIIYPGIHILSGDPKIGKSLSIENQKLILGKYAEEHGFFNCKEQSNP